MNTPQTLTQNESDHMLELARRLSVRNYAMLFVMLNTGLRVSELCGLIMDDMVIQGTIKRILIVRREISKRETQREIPLSPSLQKTLQEYLAWALAKRGSYEAVHPFFQQYDRIAPLTSRQVERIIRQIGRDALGRRVHPHMLRHTFATNLLKVSNTVIVQQVLGHKNLSSTQVYVHPTSDDRVDAILKMEKNGEKKI